MVIQFRFRTAEAFHQLIGSQSLFNEATFLRRRLFLFVQRNLEPRYRIFRCVKVNKTSYVGRASWIREDADSHALRKLLNVGDKNRVSIPGFRSCVDTTWP